MALACALALAALATACSVAPRADAAPLQPGFTETVVYSGLTDPTDIAFSPDNRVFVAEKSGLIKVYPNLSTNTPTIAADLRTQVHNFWDRGLLSIALDPQFPTRPYLYAFFTKDAAIGATAPKWGTVGASSDGCPDPPGATDLGCVVSTSLVKLTLSGNVATSEQTLINDWCQQFPSHSAGGLVFGPDGMLYASGGDGASFNFTDYGQEGNVCADAPSGVVGGTQSPPTAEGGALRSQDFLTPADPTGLNGSLIRIDPDTGAGVPGNPMFSSSDANARRIVAAGMRNPFRFTFRPGTNPPELYIGDVGWGAWEEIDRLPNATDATVDNFGWPCYEGVGRSPAYEGAGLNLCKQLYNTAGSTTAPFFTYNHSAEVVSGEECKEFNGSSVSGLAFYQGGNYPAAYSGALFFADYSRSCTWVMFLKNGQPDPSTRVSFLNEDDPVNIKIGPGGDLFVVDFGGAIRRVSYPGGNRAPNAVALAAPQAGPLPLTVNFDATTSSDPDAGDTLTYAWDLDGDGQYDDSNAAKPSWTYTTEAAVTVGLKATDKGGLSDTDTVVIGAGNEPPDAQIESPTAALHWAVGDKISFSGKGVDPQEGTLGTASMSWALVMRHCITLDDCHSHSIQSYPGVDKGEFTAPEHEYPSHLELRLTVTDKGGLTNTETLRLDPKTVDLTFRSEPTGLALGVGQQKVTAPFTQTVIVGAKLSVAAESPQSLNGTLYGFSSWSDGGAAGHEVLAPSAPTTYTASYKVLPAPPGLVLGYGFEETSGLTATDSSTAKNNGTINGPTSTASGKFGRALSFDGTNDRVDVPDANSLDLSTGMTLEAWLKPTTNSGWRTGVVKERGTNSLVYALYASNGAQPNTENFTSGENTATGTAGLALNTWTHLASTYDGTTLRLYVNGTQVSSKAVSGTMPNTANPLRIGGNAIWGEYFSGLIDEVRVYNRALSASEIGADMNTAVVGAPPPTDSTPPSAPGSLNAAGSLGKVTLTWNASTDDTGVTGYEVYRSTTPAFTPALANRIATPSTPGYVDNVAAGTYYYRVKAVDAAGNLSASSGEATGTSTADTAPSAPANLTATGSLGKVTLGWSASTDDFGVSGYEVYRSTIPGFTPALANRIATPSTPGYVDNVAAGTYYYRVKAVDTAGNLSAASSEAVGVSAADTTPPTGVAVTSPAAGTVSGTIALKASASDNVGVAGVQFLVDGVASGAEDTSAPYEVQWNSAAVANGTHKISARARDAAGNTTTSSEVSVTVSNAVASGLVLALGFEETSGLTATDSSTAKNNGTINGPTSTASGKFGRALSFDGTNDRVDVPDANSLDLTTGMTLEAWLKPTTNSGWRTALMKERSGGLLYALYASNGAKPDTENFTSGENIATGTTALPLNAWTHLASTYDGTTLRLFFNGTQVASKAVTGSMPNTTLPLRIGGNAIWGEYFSGLIDEVRVYNRALSAAEIGADMNAAVKP